MNLRLEILAEMRRQGLTQKALSQMSGISEPRISEWLSGKRPKGATEPTINAVLKALGMRVLPKEPPDRSPSSKRKS